MSNEIITLVKDTSLASVIAIPEILMNAKEYLLENGNLFLVIRKEQGAKSIISDLEKEYNVEILEKSKGFCKQKRESHFAAKCNPR